LLNRHSASLSSDSGLNDEFGNDSLNALNASAAASQAKKAFEHLLSISPHGLYAADATLALAEMDAEDTDLASALKRYSYILDNFPHHPRYIDALYRAAIICVKLHKIQQGKDYLQHLIDNYPESTYIFQGYLEKARLELSEENYTEAGRSLTFAGQASDRKTSAEVQFLKGELLERTGFTEKALKQYLKVIYLYSDVEDVKFRVCIHASGILKKQNKIRDARTILEKAKDAAVTESQKREVDSLLKTLSETGGAS